MKKTSDVLGIILARGGSKRLPGKNVMSLGGKPLLAYTCEAAKGSTLLTRTILSTDSDEIAAIGREHGIEVPFVRPAHLSSDESDSIDALRHALLEMQRLEHYEPSLVVLLQPTSPMRTTSHIDEGIRLMQSTDADSIVSVTEIPYLHTPSLVTRIQDDRLVLHSSEPHTDSEKYYAYNGAVYVFRADRLLQSQDPYGEHCVPLIMDHYCSIDINTADDIKLAEMYLKNNLN